MKTALGKIVRIVLISAAFCNVEGQTQSNLAMPADRLHLKLGHASFISALSVSPNGTYLATVSSDRTARLWLIETGDEHCGCYNIRLQLTLLPL